MTTTRPYRRALAPSDALVELLRCSGTQFDPEVAAALCAEVAIPHQRVARSATAGRA